MNSYDPEFQRRLEKRLDEHEEDGRLGNPKSLYNVLRKSHHALIEAVEKVIGDDGVGPFTITIVVEGERKVYPPGPRLY